jgi:hypothetical protein
MKKVLRDVQIIVDGTDLSDHFQAVTVNDGANAVGSTAFGSKYEQSMKGLRTAQITGTLQQDFDAGSVDAVMSALNEQDEPFEVLVIPDDGPISATNPGYHMPEAILMGYTPLSGSPGELSTTDITFDNAGNEGVKRLVAPLTP